MIRRYRKRPIVIEAIQYTPSTCGLIHNWMGIRMDHPPDECGSGPLIIHTLEGDHEAQVGDWIICGIKGEFYPCKPDIFETTYECADPDLSV